jgi:signal transduction histidine kinase/ActR/RegA family two-component response regulator
MADRIRARDWRATPLGPMESWPHTLRNVVDLMLEARQPVCIGWGPELSSLYNDAFIAAIGGRHETALGMPFRVLFADNWDEFTPLIAATMRGEAQSFEGRPVPLVGREPALSGFTLSFTPLRNDTGTIAGCYCAAHETTQKVRAAQVARRASESRYRALFNSIDEGFCLVEVAFDDSGKACDYRILETNPAFEHQTGISNAVGKWMRDLQPQQEQLWSDAYGRVASTGQSTRLVAHARTLGRWFNVFAFRVGPAEAHQVAILFSDITERIEADQALRSADRRKDEFLATLAHELRNPLAPLRNGLQLLRQQSSRQPVLQHTVAMMDRQLTHLVRLVDDLLDVGRISSGKIELRREPLSLEMVLAASIEASRVCLEQRGHEFKLEGDASRLAVLADQHRLTQVFTNLLSNACKYTEPGGRIRMTVMRQGGEAVVRVTDSGIGIPAADTARVFELFSQVRAHQPLHAGGLGIGLSLVRSLVKLHGGEVEASSPGANLGSTFTVRLPLIEQAVSAGQARVDRAPAAAEARRVVVADDNLDSAGTLAELLRLQGHEVWTASDGVEAVAQASERHPHAILLDLGMPRMDGIEAARRIRALPGGEKPLIVALTGWGQHADRERTHAAGFDCHLVKPADPDEILGLIERGCGTRAVTQG